ncbi:hypothetical protein K458DRAFT_390842 [Lentithecium fluviatile CBS 122367]|uniref:Uncharacterized protein n=1 Tax=Lentithecium fluviatile CBS 122367 TaxID=1168545 RepID=A0A6G1IW69_9PLEO|nr:hypothetical protein K458DRAFT_390842 [Lentithecium fluviatile CBS 122367]
MASSTVTADTIALSDAQPPNITLSHPAQMRPRTGTADTSSSPPASLRTNASWKSFRSTFSIPEEKKAHLGWLIALLSVLLTIVALSPAFKSQDMSEKALRLAEWTALKDYIEECREELATGIDSQACRRAMNAELPPPPYVKPGVLDRLRRSLVHVQAEHNGTSREPQLVHRQIHVPALIQGIVFLVLILIACTFLFLSFESNRSRMRRHSNSKSSSEKEEEQMITSFTPPPVEPELSTTTVRYPPNPKASSLRRRTVRTHPIYRHVNLEEALHHCDLAEIRLRLQNGEDVNQHWPYLIYKLAITPPTADTPKQIEVARLCLDFGADVNALKGWNGQSALMITIHFGNVDVAKLLIANGATVGYSPPDSNLTALHRCVRLAVTGSSAGALEIMTMLFNYGADPDQEDRNYETALHKLLIEAWLKRDLRGTSKRFVPAALCLIDHGARVPGNIKEKYTKGNPLWDVVCSAAESRGKKVGREVSAVERERYYLALYESFHALVRQPVPQNRGDGTVAY